MDTRRTSHALHHELVLAVRAHDEPVQLPLQVHVSAVDETNVKPMQTWRTYWSCWSRCLRALTCVGGISEGCRIRMCALFTLWHGAQVWCSSSRWPHRSSSSSKCILRSIRGRHSLCIVARGCSGNRRSTPIPTERYGIVVVISDPYVIVCLTIPGLTSMCYFHSAAPASPRSQSRIRRLAVIAEPVGI